MQRYVMSNNVIGENKNEIIIHKIKPEQSRIKYQRVKRYPKDAERKKVDGKPFSHHFFHQ